MPRLCPSDDVVKTRRHGDEKYESNEATNQIKKGS